MPYRSRPPVGPDGTSGGPKHRAQPRRLRTTRPAKYLKEYHISPDRCRSDPTNFRWPDNINTLNAPSVSTAGRTRRNFWRAKTPNTATKAANDEPANTLKNTTSVPTSAGRTRRASGGPNQRNNNEQRRPPPNTGGPSPNTGEPSPIDQVTFGY